MILDKIHEQPNIAQKKMIADHEYERFKLLLRYRLADCGWVEEVTRLCKQVLRDEDIDLICVDDVVDKVTPRARSLVPATVKKELLQKIKVHLMEEAGLLK